MKQTGRPIYPTELAPAAKVTGIETDYKAADKTISDTVTALTTTVGNNKTAQDLAISSAIAEWAADRQYKTNQIVIRNKTFFVALKDGIGKDPIVDQAGFWGIFNPGQQGDVFSNRSPNSSDVYVAGTKWFDVSYGSDTSLNFISLGSGSWQYLNQIALSKIRFFANGFHATYRSDFYNIKFFKADGNQIPNSWFVWGNRSGIGWGVSVGLAYSGQNVDGDSNASGWVDIEPSALFDTTVSVAKITGSLRKMRCSQIQFIYSNGGTKTYSVNVSGDDPPAVDAVLINSDPPIPSRYGDAIAAALGQTLTAAKLADSASTEAGRVTGAEFVSAWNALYQQQPAVQANSLQPTIDALVVRIEALEAKVP